jgi:hypothetical protein
MHRKDSILAGMAFVVSACSEAHEPQPQGSLPMDGSAVAEVAGDASALPGPGAPVGGGSPLAGGGATSGPSVATPGGIGLPAGGATGGGGSSPGGSGATGMGGVGWFQNPPPGCNDNAAKTRAWIADDRTFVISDAEQPCGAPASAATRAAGDCARELTYVTYHVPSLSVPGTYRLGSEASIVIERRFPISATDQGCTCLPSVDVPESVTPGTIEIALYDGGRIAVEIEAGDLSQGILIGRCPSQ